MCVLSCHDSEISANVARLEPTQNVMAQLDTPGDSTQDTARVSKQVSKVSKEVRTKNPNGSPAETEDVTTGTGTAAGTLVQKMLLDMVPREKNASNRAYHIRTMTQQVTTKQVLLFKHFRRQFSADNTFWLQGNTTFSH